VAKQSGGKRRAPGPTAGRSRIDRFPTGVRIDGIGLAHRLRGTSWFIEVTVRQGGRDRVVISELSCTPTDRAVFSGVISHWVTELGLRKTRGLR
jgi:hypothetical protein